MTGSPELDIEEPGALLEYLHREGLIEPGEEPRVTVLTGGVSNRTVLVERDNGQDWVVKQALAKLRVAVDWFSDPGRIHREADGLRWLAELAPPGSITPIAFEDHRNHLLGMSAVPQPHQNWKAMLLGGELQVDHVHQFARLIGQVHRESQFRLSELRPVFADRSFFESLRVEPYFRYAARQVPESAWFYDALIRDTYARQDTLVHGDFSPKNVLVHEGHLFLLDHEVIHLGDPGFDLGFAMTHFLSKSHHLPERRDQFARATEDFWERYRDTVSGSDALWNADLEPRAVRHTLGCLLARVRGRSPLEYLSAAEQDRQARVVSAIMMQPPATIAELVAEFTTGIEERDG